MQVILGVSPPSPHGVASIWLRAWEALRRALPGARCCAAVLGPAEARYTEGDTPSDSPGVGSPPPHSHLDFQSSCNWGC